MTCLVDTCGRFGYCQASKSPINGFLSFGFSFGLKTIPPRVGGPWGDCAIRPSQALRCVPTVQCGCARAARVYACHVSRCTLPAWQCAEPTRDRVGPAGFRGVAGSPAYAARHARRMGAAAPGNGGAPALWPRKRRKPPSHWKTRLAEAVQANVEAWPTASEVRG